MMEYLMRPKITNLKHPGKIIDVKIAGASFKVMLTPLVNGVIFGATDEYTLVTLLQAPWYSYPFKLPLAHYVGDDYILEKLYCDDKSKLEEAKKLCYLLKKTNLF